MNPDFNLPQLPTALPAQLLPLAAAVLVVIALALFWLERGRGRRRRERAWAQGQGFPPAQRADLDALHETGAATAGRRAKADLADVLTMIAAGIATAVAAQGMWRVAGDVLHLPIVLRTLVFAFLEISVIASAVRARRSMREHGKAGPDGAAVWVLTCLSAVLSSLDSRSMPEHVARLSAPLVAAWLWERGMAVEHRRRSGQVSRINWRVSPERILIRLGLADPTDRTASDVDAQRRLIRLALAASRARGLSGRRRRWALARLDRAVQGAVAHAGLAVDPTRQGEMLAHLGVLVHAQQLVELQPPSPWGDRLTIGSALTGSPAVPVAAQMAESALSTDQAAAASDAGGAVRVGGTSSAVPVAPKPARSADGAPSIPTSTRPRARSARAGGRPRTSGVDSPIPNADAWAWYQQERRNGRDPSEGDFMARFNVPRSTAGRWRRSCDAAFESTMATPLQSGTHGHLATVANTQATGAETTGAETTRTEDIAAAAAVG